ncbi:ribonuclease H-like protein [Lepidopterella palustris CBS 459.81]|uniref:poly(A)-specific ribonuclease n=1 Tax=Lepidopterella palustris CBS 459.81 TaxID=1314670 RepID=A0A8E2E2H5_9PEZI|nr:ribonuclease H-like protein [Lepidopterella palustris CBS 459.81]
MAPTVSRFQGSNPSNPFAHLSSHPLHQQQHLQQQHQQNLAHPGFGAGGNPAHNLNLFGANQNNFPGPNVGLGGGLAAAGLGGAVGLGGAGGGTGLASHAAQMGFAHGAQLQQEAALGRVQDGAKGMGQRIREVWRGNLHQEMEILRGLVDQYPYISMDTEFPGVVARPMGEFSTKASYHYQTVRCNVDLLKIIQLGITLFSITGDVPPSQLDSATISLPNRPQYANNLIMCPCTWTFNFQFSLEDDMYNEDSIQILKKSGADFEKHATQGIDPSEFGSLLITSGLTLNSDVNWISFHSGYDFAYLVKMLWCRELPPDEDSYRNLVNIFFPRLLDVKFLWRHANKLVQRNAIGQQAITILNNLGMKSGLQDLADELGCQRIGNQHSAGSDAWLTGSVFWEMRRKVFDGTIPEDMNGQMWGLTGVGAPASAASQAAALAGNYQQGAMNGQGMMSFHTGGTPNTHREGGGGPSTPTTNAVGLASTPGPGQSGHGGGMMTPGGAFGNFTYGGK